MNLPSPFSISADLVEWNRRVAQQKYDDPIKKVIKQALDASCTVIVRANGEEWTGSGFHIGNGYIATAAHVASPELMAMPHEIHAIFDSQAMYLCDVIASEPNYDCAILVCPQIAEVVPPVTFANSDRAEVGDIIAVIGAPEGWNNTATVGRITNIHQTLGENAPSPAWQDIIFIDADILQGASGGMVIGTDGLVYGLVMGVTGTNAQIGIGENSVCPSNKIHSLLASYLQKNGLQQI
jgi:S1-C subfamily serine protease